MFLSFVSLKGTEIETETFSSVKIWKNDLFNVHIQFCGQSMDKVAFDVWGDEEVKMEEL